MDAKAPDHIDLVYRKVGDNHVFASKGIKGLVHVAHADLKTAIVNAISALNLHVSKTYGKKVCYVCDSDLDKASDQREIGDIRVFGAHLDHHASACH